MLSIVVGTRPECIKVAPLVKALKDLGVPHQVIHTNQHQDLWKGSGLVPDIFLDPTPFDPEWDTIAEGIGERLGPIIGITDVLVQGDTLSAYAGASKCMGRLIHLEAGVRSGDDENPWPEEGIRRTIDLWASLAFCATPTHIKNLTREGFKGTMFLTGNTGVDACLSRQSPVPVENRHSGTVLMTLHRRESFGSPLRTVVAGISEFARLYGDLQVQWPLHPNPEIQASFDPHALPKNVKIGPPLAYSTFLNKLAHARFVVTDSGGVQEDACTLGIPCVVAREVTDRPESVESGQAVVCGRTKEGVIEGMMTALRGELTTDPSSVYGDGHSAERIATLIQETR